MTYSESARRSWGSCFYAWLHGWRDYEAGIVEYLRAEYPRRAYAAGRVDRARAGRVSGEMLIEKGVS